MAELEIHASAVVIAEAGVIIRGASGSGKSRLALALIAIRPLRRRFRPARWRRQDQTRERQRTADRERPSADPRPDRAKGGRNFAPALPQRRGGPPRRRHRRRRRGRPLSGACGRTGWLEMRGLGFQRARRRRTRRRCACPCSSCRIRRPPPISPTPCCAISGPANPARRRGRDCPRRSRGAIGATRPKKIGEIRRFPIHFTCQDGRNAQNAFRFCAGNRPHRPRRRRAEAEGNRWKSGSSRRSCHFGTCQFDNFAASRFPHGAACFEPSNHAAPSFDQCSPCRR